MNATRTTFVEIAKAHGIVTADFSEPDSRFLNVHGTRFHYLDWGGGGVPIFFVHGGGQTAYTWDLVCCQMRKHFRCLGMDCRNHGLTDKTEGRLFGYAEQGADIKGMVEALGLKDFVLIGMSMGGLASLAYAAAYPETLRALAMVDVTPTLSVQRRQETYQFMAAREFDSFDHAVEWALKLNPGRPRLHMEYSMRHSLEQRSDGKWAWKNQRRTRMRSETPEDRAKRMADTEALWGEPPKVLCPALVVHGELSNVTTRADAERLATLLPKGRVITVLGATHTVQGDQPKVLAQELIRFLDEVI